MQLPGIHFGLRRRMVAELHLVADAAVFVERHHVEPPVRPKPGQVVEVRTDVVDPNRHFARTVSANQKLLDDLLKDLRHILRLEFFLHRNVIRRLSFFALMGNSLRTTSILSSFLRT